MLVIRQEQMEVLRAAAAQTFADAMVTHLTGFSTPLAQVVGPERLRIAIEFGIKQAAGYGFDARGPVRLYLELMLLFGCRFDTDPQYPWAAEILSDRDSAPQMQRAQDLYERTLDYRRQVAGPADANTLKALRNIQALAGQTLRFAPHELVPFMLEEIALIYPEKAAYIGAEALTALIRKAGEGARNLRFTTPRGMALVVLLFFSFGHGCGADPLYPWIAHTLRDQTLTDPEAKAERLEKRALTWLEQVLAHLAQEPPT
ncbi:hypothetical protein [uncultured Thiodictyon sp.]|uniref:hypothetical protein n=1 Tax=uncultured Thiodictyon sp. TaxID=1846217 RepID=UPI0025FC01F6|nr:hypothetical protein [uncultured Thiodictyon sp.]